MSLLRCGVFKYSLFCAAFLLLWVENSIYAQTYSLESHPTFEMGVQGPPVPYFKPQQEDVCMVYLEYLNRPSREDLKNTCSEPTKFRAVSEVAILKWISLDPDKYSALLADIARVSPYYKEKASTVEGLTDIKLGINKGLLVFQVVDTSEVVQPIKLMEVEQNSAAWQRVRFVRLGEKKELPPSHSCAPARRQEDSDGIQPVIYFANESLSSTYGSLTSPYTLSDPQVLANKR